jgi:4,5-dihydroxyphthalate decarboxylase
MAELHLSTVTRTQGNNAALTDGTIKPRGAALDFVDVPVLVQAFRRMVREDAYDVSEMAITTYLVAKAHGARFTTARSASQPAASRRRTWRADGSGSTAATP